MADSSIRRDNPAVRRAVRLFTFTAARKLAGIRLK